jgi:hypothetical protein
LSLSALQLLNPLFQMADLIAEVRYCLFQRLKALFNKLASTLLDPSSVVSGQHFRLLGCVETPR